MVDKELSSGFSQDQLIIYKLGHIESQLASLIAKHAEHTLEIHKTLGSYEKRLTNLETQFNNIRSKFIGGLAVVSFVLVGAKVLIDKWLSLL